MYYVFNLLIYCTDVDQHLKVMTEGEIFWDELTKMANDVSRVFDKQHSKETGTSCAMDEGWWAVVETYRWLNVFVLVKIHLHITHSHSADV
jgi:hypothetical protein